MAFTARPISRICLKMLRKGAGNETGTAMKLRIVSLMRLLPRIV
jgi:hypothetical protein